MKITLFGATGKTGPYIIQEALNRGYEVTVVARLSSKFEHPDVLVLRGNLDDLSLLREAVRGSDAVLSALGPSKIPHPGGLPVATAMKSIISAMTQEKVERLITISTGTAPDPGDTPVLKVWLPAQLMRLGMPNAYRDIIALAQSVRRSGLKWTMVRVAFLKNTPATHHLNVGLYGRSKHSLTVSREDVAIFMLDQIPKADFIGKAPGISSRRENAQRKAG